MDIRRKLCVLFFLFFSQKQGKAEEYTIVDDKTMPNRLATFDSTTVIGSGRIYVAGCLFPLFVLLIV